MFILAGCGSKGMNATQTPEPFGPTDPGYYKFVVTIDIGLNKSEKIQLFTNDKPQLTSSPDGGGLIVATNVFCPKDYVADNYDRDLVGCIEDFMPSWSFYSPKRIAVSEREP